MNASERAFDQAFVLAADPYGAELHVVNVRFARALSALDEGPSPSASEPAALTLSPGTMLEVWGIDLRERVAREAHALQARLGKGGLMQMSCYVTAPRKSWQ